MNLKKTLEEYYSKRAKEYERVYNRPDKIRVKEQKILAEYISKTFKNKFVLELACGTGFWTKHLIKTAKKILATDYNLSMLEIASLKLSKNSNTIFLQADAYNPPTSSPKFNGVLANFWFSHIPKSKIAEFLDTIHLRLEKNTVVMFADDIFTKGSGGEFVINKNNKDTFKKRVLNSGEKFDILKNYYKKEELLKIFTKYSKKVEVKYLTNFWIVKYII